MDEPRGSNSLLILYGSETGTAQDVAEGFWRDAKHRRIPVRVFELDDYTIEVCHTRAKHNLRRYSGTAGREVCVIRCFDLRTR